MLARILFFMFPLICWAQLDVPSGFVRITNESLPEVPPVPRFRAEAGDLDFRKRLQSFKVTAQNYQQPVDMLAALQQTQAFRSTKITLDLETAGLYGLTGFGPLPADGATSVKNTVYQEMRGLYLFDDTVTPSLSPLRRMHDRGFRFRSQVRVGSPYR